MAEPHLLKEWKQKFQRKFLCMFNYDCQKESTPTSIGSQSYKVVGEFWKTCETERTQLYQTMSETKAAFAERTICFSKNLFHRYMGHYRYKDIHNLSHFVTIRNHTKKYKKVLDRNDTGPKIRVTCNSNRCWDHSFLGIHIDLSDANANLSFASVGFTVFVLMFKKRPNIHFWRKRLSKMVASRQEEVPFCRCIGRERARRFDAFA